MDKADETVNVPEPTVNPDRSGLAYDYFYYNEISDNRDNQYHPDFDDYEFYYKNIYKYDLQAVPWETIQEIIFENWNCIWSWNWFVHTYNNFLRS